MQTLMTDLGHLLNPSDPDADPDAAHWITQLSEDSSSPGPPSQVCALPQVADPAFLSRVRS